MTTTNTASKTKIKDIVAVEQEQVSSTSAQIPSCLVDKKVRLKFIPRFNSPITNNVSEATAYMYTMRSFILPKNINTGKFVNPLTEDERAYLENRLGINLDPFKDKDNYWYGVRVTIRKEDLDLDNNFVEFDLSDPYQFLQYKMVLANNTVAPVGTTDFRPDQFYYIEDIVVDTKVKYSMEEDFDKANEFKNKMKNSKTALYGFLKVLGMTNKNIKINRRDTKEYLYSYLGSLMRDPATLPKVMKLINDIEKDEVTYNNQLIVIDGIEIGEIVHTTNGYQHVDGTYMGSDFNDVVMFFKNPANSSLKSKVRIQIKNNLPE